MNTIKIILEIKKNTLAYTHISGHRNVQQMANPVSFCQSPLSDYFYVHTVHVYIRNIANIEHSFAINIETFKITYIDSVFVQHLLFNTRFAKHD